jgi:thymidylate synthase (FAD)
MSEIVTPQIQIRHLLTRAHGIALLREIEFYGRHSHDAQDKMSDTSWEKFIQTWVVEHGDWSITEHEKVTVIATMDRGISHEWVRHRVGSYTQESTRFVNYTKSGRSAKFIRPALAKPESARVWEDAMAYAEGAYKELVRLGEAPQIARSVFPTALKTTVVTTFNLRNWRHFLLMRTCREAHPQIKEICIPLLVSFQERIPLLYADITPEEPQRVAAARAR